VSLPCYATQVCWGYVSDALACELIGLLPIRRDQSGPVGFVSAARIQDMTPQPKV
jgi:hypothetical protein